MITTAEATAVSRSRPRRRLHAWIRQLHVWIGAWGAIAAILYGSTGLLMNHRFGDAAWPQGESAEIGRSRIAVPAEARASAESLSLWLHAQQGLEAQMIRKPGADAKGPPKWTLAGGGARASWSLEYTPGDDHAALKRSTHTPLAALNRLHKSVAGGTAWRLLADSFAIGMILLGISGIGMWARGRSPQRLLMSVFAVSVMVLGWVLVPTLL
jgi:hypothetical protein